MRQNAFPLALAAALLASAASAAVPRGSFGGSSPALSNPDIMALLIRPDAADARLGYAVLAEYDRLPFIPGPERLRIARWVPRVYIYRVQETAPGRYAMKPLRVSASGGLELDPGYLRFGELTLARGRLEGAAMTRYEKGSTIPAETISFAGRVSSTWEPYVPGRYFRSTDSTGGDYTHDRVNTVLRADRVAEFSHDPVSGTFDIAEPAPGIFTFKARPGARGAERIETRIGVFIDIVNWKPVATTDELLLVNPEDARDVGFYYERH